MKFVFVIFLYLLSSAFAEDMMGTKKDDELYIESVQKQLLAENLDFRLSDQFGDAWSFSDFSKKTKALIYSFDPVCEVDKQHKQIKELEKKFKNTSILLMNSRFDVSRESLTEKFPKTVVMLDEFQQLAKELRFRQAGDYVIYDFKKDNVVKTFSNVQFSCPLFFETIDGQNFQDQISYSFSRACLNCHNKMQGFTYFQSLNTIKDWRKMMLKTIQLKRMPPGADPYYGALDTEHTNADIRKVVAWLNAGAPFTQKDEDVFQIIRERKKKWKKESLNGEEHNRIVLISRPDESVLASGSDFYKHYTTTTPTTEDIYFSNFEINVNENVAHHLALHFSDKPFPLVDLKGKPIAKTEMLSLYGNNPVPINGYVNGKKVDSVKFLDPNIIHVSRRQGFQSAPGGTLYHIPKGSYLNFEIHYNPSGKDEVSKVEFAIYKLPTANPKMVMKRFSMTPLNGSVIAAPNEAHSVVQLDYQTEYDMLIKGFGLHMHYRGKSGKVTFQRPGEKTSNVLFSFPTYQYKNQLSSILKESVLVPKGSILSTQIIYDNSKGNKAITDFKRPVKIGTSVSKDENYLPRFLYLEP